MWIHCAVVCSQVCRCTVNSSTLRAPKTDEWGQRSTVPISCSLGYVTQVLFYTLRLLRTWTWRVQLSTSPMSLFMLSSDNQYFLLAGLVCVCVLLSVWNPCMDWISSKVWRFFQRRSVPYVQLSRLHFHPATDAMWRTAHDSCCTSTQTHGNNRPRAHERVHHIYPCLHVHIEDLNVHHRSLMISNDFCWSASFRCDEPQVQVKLMSFVMIFCSSVITMTVFDQCPGNTWFTMVSTCADGMTLCFQVDFSLTPHFYYLAKHEYMTAPHSCNGYWTNFLHKSSLWVDVNTVHTN